MIWYPVPTNPPKKEGVYLAWRCGGSDLYNRASVVWFRYGVWVADRAVIPPDYWAEIPEGPKTPVKTVAADQSATHHE